jgi:hypothetical protein
MAISLGNEDDDGDVNDDRDKSMIASSLLMCSDSLLVLVFVDSDKVAAVFARKLMDPVVVNVRRTPNVLRRMGVLIF